MFSHLPLTGFGNWPGPHGFGSCDELQNPSVQVMTAPHTFPEHELGVVVLPALFCWLTDCVAWMEPAETPKYCIRLV